MLARRDLVDRCVFCAFRAEFARQIRPHQARLSSIRDVRARSLSSAAVHRKEHRDGKNGKFSGEGRGKLPVRNGKRNGRDEEGWTGELQKLLSLQLQPERAEGRGDGLQPGTIRKTAAPPRKNKEKTFVDFTKLKVVLLQRLDALETSIMESPASEAAGSEQDSLKAAFSAFRDHFRQEMIIRTKPDNSDLFWRIVRLYKDKGPEGLDAELKYLFHDSFMQARFTKSDIENQKALADIRYPMEWYTATREMKRKIHLHVGPTNSGKTYHALKRLEAAKSGIYAGPLRLLAHEVYTRMNAKGIPCALITGEERRMPDVPADQSVMSACTVEMIALNNPVDVAVIDEIQMIGDEDRGWAWTQAFLGVRAKEVHLCGEERTVPLIKALAAAMGDELEVHTYRRLSPLQMMDSSLKGDLRNLQKGDCVVAFSVMAIHALRAEIEKVTGRRVAVVYGSLPPETRAQQARLFNDPDNDYDFLVASDAVGMGLNLSIKRIIFEAAHKFDGTSRRTLRISDIKQIGGRAGRYRTAHQATQESKSAAESNLDIAATPPTPSSTSVGLVTTLEPFDFPIVEAAMQSDAEPIKTAGIMPPESVVERFSSYFPPGTPFSYIMLRLHDISQIHPRFHLCNLKDQAQIADAIQSVKGLTPVDRLIFCASPANPRDPVMKKLALELAKRVADQKGGSLLDIPEFELELLDEPVTARREYLRKLETLHKGLVLYLWLSFRFKGIFTTRALANYTKVLVEEKIDAALAQFSFNRIARQKDRKLRERALLDDLKRQLGEGEDPEDVRTLADALDEDEEDVSARDEETIVEGEDEEEEKDRFIDEDEDGSPLQSHPEHRSTDHISLAYQGRRNETADTENPPKLSPSHSPAVKDAVKTWTQPGKGTLDLPAIQQHQTSLPP